MVELMSGGVYRRGVWDFVLIFMDHKKVNDELVPLWGMLHIHRHAVSGMSCPMFQYGKDNEHMFTEEELEKDYDLKNWKFLDGRLRLEKIDNMSLVDFPIGHLEDIEKNDMYPKLLKEIKFKKEIKESQINEI